MIEEKLTALLKQVTPKVYPLVAPANVSPPFATYSRVRTPRLSDLDGATGLAMPTFRVNAYGLGFIAVRQLANAIRVALTDFSDDEILHIELVNEFDLSDLTGDANIKQTNLEFRTTHRE